MLGRKFYFQLPLISGGITKPQDSILDKLRSDINLVSNALETLRLCFKEYLEPYREIPRTPKEHRVTLRER